MPHFFPSGLVTVPAWGQGGPVAGGTRVLARPSVQAEGVDGEHGPGVVTVGSRVVQTAYQRLAWSVVGQQRRNAGS